MADILEISESEMKVLGYRAVDLIAAHLAGLGNKRVGRKASPEYLRESLMEPVPRAGRSADEIFACLEETIFPNIMNICHPRFFAFVPGPANFISVVADALAAGFNVFNGSWLGASSAAAIELTVIEWLTQLCGFPAGAGGIFVSGGSMANLTALTVARRVVLEDRVEGAVAYCSDQTHSSVERALRVIGFLPEQIRHVPADGRFRISVERLADLIEADRMAERRPFCVIANAGTTSTGAVDELKRISEICNANGMWMHVDGAYGAAAVITERGRGLLEGMQLADSLSLDPHKWLFQTIECGCVLLRDAALLKSTFRTTPAYLAEVHRDGAEVNPCDYGVQLTRSFRALKLWMSLQYFGLDAFVAAVERGFALAEFAERLLRGRVAWKVVTPAEMGIVTFRWRGADEEFYEKLHEAMLRSGYALLSTTLLNGETVLRLCTINFRATEEDVETTLDWLEALAAEIQRATGAYES